MKTVSIFGLGSGSDETQFKIALWRMKPCKVTTVFGDTNEIPVEHEETELLSPAFLV